MKKEDISVILYTQEDKLNDILDSYFRRGENRLFIVDLVQLRYLSSGWSITSDPEQNEVVKIVDKDDKYSCKINLETENLVIGRGSKRVTDSSYEEDTHIETVSISTKLKRAVTKIIRVIKEPKFLLRLLVTVLLLGCAFYIAEVNTILRDYSDVSSKYSVDEK